MKNWLFWKIIEGKEPGRIIYEDKEVICFLLKTGETKSKENYYFSVFNFS